jgi:DNA-binding NarL/FixJ family response regulator
MHPVVCAYRVSPELVSDVVGDAELAPPMRDLLWRARDETTGRGAGLDFPRVRTRELSPREAEVLALLGEGLSNRDIGKRLFISEVTAKAHVRHIFEKLGVRSRTEAALMSAVYLDDSDDSV